MRRGWLTLLLASNAAAAQPASEPVAPGEGFEVTSYAVTMTPDIAAKAVSGRETIVLRATRDGVRRLRFSGNALSVDRASIDGVVVAVERGDDGLAFLLPAPLAARRAVTLRVDYHGRPARGLVGTGTSLYTSYFACDWMICVQDAFGDKAAFTLELRVPAGMGSLSVGRMVARRREADGSEVHRWQAPRPYSAYLFGFAVGQFVEVRERAGTARLRYLSDIANATELKRRFGGTRDIAIFFADRAGVPLPVAEYGQLLVAGEEAQEAATYAVLGTDALPRTADPAEDWAIAHELAHQWWGNLVTCANLREFWLNEGITTFMTAAWKEHRYGRAAYEAELQVARQRLARARAAGFDKPLAWAGRYPTLGMRRAVQYSKGALFMAQLRVELGDAAFWSGLKRYTRAHAGGTVTSRDLQRAMEAASGRELQHLFAAWVYGP